MATARDARDWARSALRGIGDSLYTPFCGPDGDDVDWDAYRTLVRHCIGTLGHQMLWCTSGLVEFWALTFGERKRLLEVASRRRAQSIPALNFFRYVADRTDIALGMFNSPSSGYVLTPVERRPHRRRDPRGVCDQGGCGYSPSTGT